jgi:hypothetical protein
MFLFFYPIVKFKRRDLNINLMAKTNFEINPERNMKISSEERAILDKVRLTCQRYGPNVSLEQISIVGYAKRLGQEKILRQLTPLLKQSYLEKNNNNNLYSITSIGLGALPEVHMDENISHKRQKVIYQQNSWESRKLTRQEVGTSEK